MARLNEKQRIAASRVTNACRDAESVPSLLADVSNILRSAVGAEAFCSSQLEPTTGLLMDAVADGWPNEAKPLLIENVLLPNARR